MQLPESEWFLPMAKAEFAARFGDAMSDFWAVKKGDRRSGEQMHSLTLLLRDTVLSAGISPEHVHTSHPRLPGYYRLSKAWDLIVRGKNGDLIAAIELKSLVEKFYKNLNNRIEEALGSSTDVHDLLEENTIPPATVFLGYAIIIGVDAESLSVRTDRQPIVKIGPADYSSKTGVESLLLACERFMHRRHYSRVASIVTKPLAAAAGPTHETDDASLASFGGLANAMFVHLKTQSGMPS